MLYATNLSNDVAPTELPRFLVRHCYKDLATAIKIWLLRSRGLVCISGKLRSNFPTE